MSVPCSACSRVREVDDDADEVMDEMLVMDDDGSWSELLCDEPPPRVPRRLGLAGDEGVDEVGDAGGTPPGAKTLWVWDE